MYPDDTVRVWANFGLANCSADSPDVRSALKRRLDHDPFENARNEALWGLARRRDPQVLVELLRRLRSEASVWGDEIAAKEALGADGEASPEELCRRLENLL
jgi:hypothetical protein